METFKIITPSVIVANRGSNLVRCPACILFPPSGQRRQAKKKNAIAKIKEKVLNRWGYEEWQKERYQEHLLFSLFKITHQISKKPVFPALRQLLRSTEDKLSYSLFLSCTRVRLQCLSLIWLLSQYPSFLLSQLIQILPVCSRFSQMLYISSIRSSSLSGGNNLFFSWTQKILNLCLSYGT